MAQTGNQYVIAYLQNQLTNVPYYDDINDNPDYQTANAQLRQLQVQIQNIQTTNDQNKQIASLIKSQIQILQSQPSTTIN